ncbi:hypothetical protein CERZMDRAFT_92208 [Cercospora zeae-maydis SCOH1-5]|uniref:Uncharacterized protein n=1 Tax=Cercospora zeae-maydis SCOH1-5 TaxID=717836 RepID=A0A6A6FWF8_9PEZI|nr:hypothetical protein CERZMDRAFT_92208 [Cercospora zeae-maydis SCOH1-5]
MPEPEPAIPAAANITGATVIEKLQAKLLDLSHTYSQGQGIERCSSLMFEILLNCRAMDKETFDSLSPTEVWKLDTVCQDAIQMVGNAAQWALAPRRDPSEEQNLAKLRLRPGIVPKLDPKYHNDPLVLRLHVLRRDMCELTAMDPNSSELVDLAADVLRLCSGKATIAHFSNGHMLWLDAVRFPKGPKETDLRYTFFDCVLLTLVEIAQWYDAWYNKMIPASWAKRSVRLWAQNVPGTGAVPSRSHYWSGDRGTNETLSENQTLQVQKLDNALQELLAIPFVESNPSGEKETRWRRRTLMVVDIIKMAVQGRALQRDPQDEDFSARLFDYAQQALNNMFIAAKINFGIRTNPNSPCIHVPVPRGAAPEYSDHRGRRQWLILKTLDTLHGTEPIMAIRCDMALSILRLVEGENLLVRMNGTSEKVPLPAVQDKDEAWRVEMLRRAEFAIVGLAQHLSARFDRRDVFLVNKLVETKKRPWDTENAGVGARGWMRQYPESVAIPKSLRKMLD